MKIYNLKKYSELLFYIISLFFINRFFQFELFQKISFLQQIYANVSRISFLIILVYFINNRIKKEDIKLLILILIYLFFILLTTVLNNGSIRSFIMMSYPIIGTVLLICIGIRKNVDLLLKSFVYLFYGLIAINFFDAILFKDLSSEYSTNYYFIGGKNQLAISFAIGFCFIKIYYKKWKTKKLKILLISYLCMIIMTSIVSKSGTCIISVMVLIILNYFKFLKRLINPFTFFCGYIALWIGLVILKIQNYFRFFIEGILHKDVTFTYRTVIWEKALKEIKKCPLLGYGMHQDTNYFKIKVIYPNGEFLKNYSGHNQIIQVLYENGIVAVIFFIIFYIICCSGKRTNNTNFIYFFNTVIIIFITWLAEAPGIYAMFVMLTFCYYSRYIKGKNI